jgi:3'(2'), 5'-bisphosphate nucleotidase
VQKSMMQSAQVPHATQIGWRSAEGVIHRVRAACQDMTCKPHPDASDRRRIITMPADVQLLNELTTVVSQAAAAILAARTGTLVIRTKSDQSPVTAADEAAETIILEETARLLPGVPVMSEEAVYRSGCRSVSGDFVLVDPVDGTRELLAGRDEFTVNVALVQAGRPALGIVAAPALGIIWRTATGRGAERMRFTPGAPASVATDHAPIQTRPFPSDAPIAIVSRSHLDAKTEAFLARLPNVRTVPAGSALKLCRVAEGAADVYPRLAPTHEWDVAAGHAVLVAAGGIVTQPTGEPLSYGRFADGLIVRGFIAWGDQAAAARLCP